MTAMLAFPVRFVSGKAVTVERDSEDEIMGCVHTCLLTRKGQRLERPDFGIRSFEFSQVNPGAAAAHIERSMLQAEPRARFVVEEDLSDLADSVLGINVGMEGAPNG